jgi:site-specific recombinase XerD
LDVRRLCASDVVQFVSERTAQYRPRTVKEVATALRLFFRFVRAMGISDNRLDEAVPTIAGWRLATLPRGLTEEQHQKLLSSLVGSTGCARRDRAIILSLSGLGLRAGEVAALELEDIDWRTGTIHVRTRKTGRGAILPLDRETGRAIVAYLRNGRPKARDRHVFVLHRGTVGAAVSGSLVARVVRQALLRAGITAPAYGAHVLRHTLASRMVQAGARLDEIADVLGHRSLNTTAIYAKVDLASLGDVPLPWPGVTS